MHTLFISDLHLCASRPEGIQAFITLLDSFTDELDALYILGDLFEFWHGDDDLDEVNLQILNTIQSLSAKNIPVYFQRGNRDFLVGKKFAEHTGVTILPDYHLIDLYEHRILIMHGDLLCTDDVDYLRMRRIFNIGLLQFLFVRLPMAFRQKVSARVRNVSVQQNEVKANELMDVSLSTVNEVMQTHGVTELIHGHTHRPNIHQFDLNGKKARRIVLGDWYGRDSVLYYSETEQQLLPVEEYLNLSSH